HVLLSAPRLEVVNCTEQRRCEVVAIWVPSRDVAAIKLEDTEASVAGKHRAFSLNLLPRATQSLFGQLYEVPRLALLVTEIGGKLLTWIRWVKGFRQLHKDVATIAAIGGV